jgi:SAM-dependent methyltransferase
MAEMAGYDARRGWDLFYGGADPVPDPPQPLARAIVSVLRELVGEGPALELAVGDGRIAIPLAATGVEVDGIDISASAIDQLRAHPRGGAVNASVADISDFARDRTYRLVYCVANSLFNLPTQEAQIRCFELVAAHLAPGGVFLIDSGYTPRWFATLPTGQYVEARRLDLTGSWLQALRVDPADQFVYQQDLVLSSRDGVKIIPSRHRYASLGELDLMARIAGLRRQDQWGGWTREPYDADSSRLVVTYAAP